MSNKKTPLLRSVLLPDTEEIRGRKALEVSGRLIKSTPMIDKLDRRLEKLGAARDAVEKSLFYALMMIQEMMPDKPKSLDGHKLGTLLLTGLILERNKRRNSSIQAEIPSEAKKLYVPRKSGKASDFLKENWGPYIDAGVMFRPDIKRLDPKLEQALTNEYRGRTEELRAILPNRSDAADAKLESEFGGPVRPEDRKAGLTAISMAKKLKQ